MRTVVLRVAALALLLLLALVAVISIRTMSRLPDTVVYFVKTESDHFRLEPVYRINREADTEANLLKALEELIAGPTPSEQERTLTTAVPEDTRINSLELEGSRAIVDVSGEFAAGGGTAMMLGRLHQLFYTLTQPGSVEEVALTVDGVPVQMFGGEGLLVDYPWVRSEREQLPAW